MNRKMLSMQAGLGLLLWGLMTMSAGAAEAPADKPAAACRDTGSFVPPNIPWMGKFAYKVAFKPSKGRPEDVEVTAVRGPDRVSNRQVIEALQDHIKHHYVCEHEAPEQLFHLMLSFRHEVPALDEKMTARSAAWQAKQSLLHAAAAASAAAAKAADMPASTLVPLVPLRAGMVCTTMGKPDVPQIQAVGTVSLHVIAEVTDGKVTLVDTKLRMGSNEPSLNQKFIDSVDRALRDTYRCPGNHIFEQEFVFKIS